MAIDTIDKDSTLSKLDFTGGFKTDKELNELAGKLALLTGESRLTTKNFLRKFLAQGRRINVDLVKKIIKAAEAGATNELEQTNTTAQTAKATNQKAPTANQAQIKGEVRAEAKAPQQQVTGEKAVQEQGQVQNQANKFYQTRSALANNRANLPPIKFFSHRFVNLNLEALRPFLSKIVVSPKDFASLLVNNKQAYIALKAYPQTFKFLLAMNNPMLRMSPSFLSELVKLIAQSFKIKQGKNQVNDDEFEQARVDRNLEEAIEEADHKARMVNSVREATSNIPVSSVKDYLLEAERFAEEEIAHLWSITLKKEKQLEKAITHIPEDIKHIIERFPHLQPKGILEKFKLLQKDKKDK